MSALMRAPWHKHSSHHLARLQGLPPEAYLYHTKRSLYFIDREPAQKGLDGLTHFVTTERENQLATIKEADEHFVTDRETSVWPVSDAAMHCGPATSRLERLSLPKPLSPNYEFLRTCYMGVAEPAKRAKASERTCRLAMSNPHKIWPSTDGYLDPGFTRPATEVSQTAMTASCSPQVVQLAEFRPLDENCQPERDLPIPVSQAALHVNATPRLKELSRPARSSRESSVRVEYDEEAVYRVSIAAQKCVASRRTVELAVPVRIKGARVSLAQSA